MYVYIVELEGVDVPIDQFLAMCRIVRVCVYVYTYNFMYASYMHAMIHALDAICTCVYVHVYVRDDVMMIDDRHGDKKSAHTQRS